MIGLNYKQFKNLNEKEKQKYLYLKDAFNYCFIGTMSYLLLAMIVYGFSMVAEYNRNFLIELPVFILTCFGTYHFVFLIKILRKIQRYKWKNLNG